MAKFNSAPQAGQKVYVANLHRREAKTQLNWTFIYMAASEVPLDLRLATLRFSDQLVPRSVPSPTVVSDSPGAILSAPLVKRAQSVNRA